VIDWDGAFAGPIEYDLSGIRKVTFAEPRKKTDEEGYEEEVQMATLFKDRVEERGGNTEVDWSFKECFMVGEVGHVLSNMERMVPSWT